MAASADQDYRVGERNRIVMQLPDTELRITVDVYRVLTTKERVCFSEAWDGSDTITDGGTSVYTRR